MINVTVMKKVFCSIGVISIFFFCLASPGTVLAVEPGPPPEPRPLPQPPAPVTPGNLPQPPAPVTPLPGVRAGIGQTVRLINPLSGISTIPQLLAAILNVIVILAIPVIIFFIMLAGFKYVTARGNPGQIEEASKALLYAVIGAVLILGATAIAQIVKNLVDAFR